MGPNEDDLAVEPSESTDTPDIADAGQPALERAVHTAAGGAAKTGVCCRLSLKPIPGRTSSRSLGLIQALVVHSQRTKQDVYGARGTPIGR